MTDSKRFNSKVDLWLVIVLLLALVLQFFVFFSVLHSEAPTSAKYMIVASTVFLALLFGSMLLRTHYTVYGDSLKIVCGPIVRTVKLSDISEVSETRSPLSSPALSLDRLRIRYGDGKSIMISPADKKGFVKAIGQKLS